jgi:branched-chain amino acid transport system permease protein
VSFIFMNIGEFWGGPADLGFPKLIPDRNLLGSSQIEITAKDLMLLIVVVPIMIMLTFLVKRTQLGRAMRATSQNPVAARLMGINVDRVIGATFLIGGALGGVASVVYGLYINTIGFQMGYQNGLYAFTAAVLGGIGNIAGAVLGGLVIGLVRSLGSGYIGEKWSDALIFGILILILVFRPAGLLGERAQEKV